MAALIPSVVAISFLPLQDKHKLHTKGHFHYPGHFLAFAAVAFLLSRATRTSAGRLLAFLVAIAFGCAIEYAQHIHFHEILEPKDILVDTLGVLSGTLLALFSLSSAASLQENA